MWEWGERRRIHFQCDALCGKRGKPSHSSGGIPPVVIVVLVPRVKVRHAMVARNEMLLNIYFFNMLLKSQAILVLQFYQNHEVVQQISL